MIIMVAIGAVAAIILLFSGIKISNTLLHKEENIGLSIGEEKTKKTNILRATRDIQAGETADFSEFEMIAVPKELIPDGTISTMQLLKDKRLANSLKKNEFLLQSDIADSSALYEDGDRLMEHTFQDGVVPAVVDVGSIVDIKLFKQGNEDTVVISKVAVVGRTQNTLSFYLNAQEQEFLKEANTEGQLFLVKYLVEGQPASEVTYYPSYGKGQAKGIHTEGFASSSMAKD